MKAHLTKENVCISPEEAELLQNIDAVNAANQTTYTFTNRSLGAAHSNHELPEGKIYDSPEEFIHDLKE